MLTIFSERWKQWKNAIIFGVDHSSSVHIDDRNKNVLVVSEGSTKGLEGATITAETKYAINFIESEKKFELSLHDNGRIFFFISFVLIWLYNTSA